MNTAGNCLAAALLVLAGPVLAQEDNWVSLAAEGGEALYHDKCGMCHEPGGMGAGILQRRLEGELALLENREDLQPEYIAAVVRNGLNTMFPLSRAEVSDGQLMEIAAYLSAPPVSGEGSRAEREEGKQDE